MNYGLYLSASGVLTNLYRQDVLANNLANAQTIGFKPDLPAVRQRDAEAVEGQFAGELRKRMLDRIGGGAFAGPQHLDLTPGPVQATSNPLDAALEQPETFFTVSANGAGGGAASVRLTRDGRFARSADGYLVTASGQHQVLDDTDQPIAVPAEGTLGIDRFGRLLHNGQAIAQIQITGVTDPQRLIKRGGNLLGFEGDQDLRQAVPDAMVKGGHVEASSVDPIRTLMALTEATRAVTDSGNLIRYHDLLLDRAVNVLGRVG